jgi:hypothetical protein
MWFAYLQRRGLITADGFPVENPPSLMDPVDTVPVPETAVPETTVPEFKTDSAGGPADNSVFTGDTPKAG